MAIAAVAGQSRASKLEDDLRQRAEERRSRTEREVLVTDKLVAEYVERGRGSEPE